MKAEIDYQALALQALQVKPAGEWRCSDLQRHYHLNYSEATILLDTLPTVTTVPSLPGSTITVPATAEGQPGLPSAADLDAVAQEKAIASATSTRTRKKRSDAGQPRPAAPKPTAPESAPAIAPVDEPEPETCPERYKRLVDEVYEASRKLRRLRNELECATADLVL
jgi:hypothetical protein